MLIRRNFRGRVLPEFREIDLGCGRDDMDQALRAANAWCPSLSPATVVWAMQTRPIFVTFYRFMQFATEGIYEHWVIDALAPMISWTAKKIPDMVSGIFLAPTASDNHIVACLIRTHCTSNLRRTAPLWLT